MLNSSVHMNISITLSPRYFPHSTSVNSNAVEQNILIVNVLNVSSTKIYYMSCSNINLKPQIEEKYCVTRQFMYTRNISGINTNPCETPYFINLKFDLAASIKHEYFTL